MTGVFASSSSIRAYNHNIFVFQINNSTIEDSPLIKMRAYWNGRNYFRNCGPDNLASLAEAQSLDDQTAAEIDALLTGLDPADFFALGVRYAEGRERDLSKQDQERIALYILGKAAKAGNAAAMTEIGASLFYCYQHVEQNLASARSWFVSAAELGDPLAMHSLARMHLLGLAGPESNTDTGIRYLRDCAALGRSKCIDEMEKLNLDLPEMLPDITSVSNSKRAFSRKDWEMFHNTSYCLHSFSESTNQDAYKMILCEVGDIQPNITEALRLYAKRLDITNNQAFDYAYLLLTAAKHKDVCDNRRPRQSDCLISHNEVLMDAIREIGLNEPTGLLMTDVGKTVSSGASVAAFIGLAMEHEKASVILGAMHHYSGDFVYFALLLARNGIEASFLTKMLEQDFPEYRSEHLLSLLDMTRGNENDTPLKELATAAMIYQMFQRGLDDQALSLFRSLNSNQRKALTTFSSGLFKTDSDSKVGRISAHLYSLPEPNHRKALSTILPGQFLLDKDTNEDQPAIQRFANLNFNLLAAQISAGDRNDAEITLLGLRAVRDRMKVNHSHLLLFFEEIFNPKLENSEIFDAFIFGYPAGDEKPEWTMKMHMGSGITGWLNLVYAQAPSVRKIGAAYLDSHGHNEMAQYILSPDMFRQWQDRITGLPLQVLNNLGDAFQAKVLSFEDEIEKANSDYESLRKTSKPSTSRLAFMQDRPIAFMETDLKESQIENERISNTVPDLEAQGIAEFQIVRGEKKENDWWVLYLSNTLDPVGEVSQGGYWLIRSADAGVSWGEPVYLGIQQFFPYVVKSETGLSMIAGQLLKLEVGIREIDRDSITFPPVGLRAAHTEDGIYLEFDLGKVLRDRDNDGLTDLVEHRLGLDYSSPDTDGDGIRDGYDSLPGIAFVKSDVQYALGIALVEALYGFERGALVVGEPLAEGTELSLEEMMQRAYSDHSSRPDIDVAATLFLQGDPGLFQGLTLPFRLIVQNDQQVEQLRENYGVHYPAGVRWMFSDTSSDRKYIIWSASWVGGVFMIRPSANGYSIEVMSRWIS